MNVAHITAIRTFQINSNKYSTTIIKVENETSQTRNLIMRTCDVTVLNMFYKGDTLDK